MLVTGINILLSILLMLFVYIFFKNLHISNYFSICSWSYNLIWFTSQKYAFNLAMQQLWKEELKMHPGMNTFVVIHESEEPFQTQDYEYKLQFKQLDP